MAFIELKNVFKRFGKLVVLKGLTLSIEQGQSLVVIGASGTGKSVLLKHIVGLLRPDSGEIWVDGHEVNRLDEDELLGVRKTCGMVFQFPALLDALTIFDNVAFGLRAHRLCGPDEEEARVRKLLG